MAVYGSLISKASRIPRKDEHAKNDEHIRIPKSSRIPKKDERRVPEPILNHQTLSELVNIFNMPPDKWHENQTHFEFLEALNIAIAQQN